MKKLKRSSRLSLFSPAKINLFLYVLSKREDGYHEIATLMQSISLGDVLHITLSDEDQLTSTSREMPHDQSNLVCRAIKHFRLKTGLLFPVSVHIEKQIPIGGGFGGEVAMHPQFYGLSTFFVEALLEKGYSRNGPQKSLLILLFFSLQEELMRLGGESRLEAFLQSSRNSI